MTLTPTGKIIELKSSLRTHWKTLKDEKLDIVIRQEAYKSIDNVSAEIKKLDSNFEIIELKNTQWSWIPSGKRPEGDNPDINWPTLGDTSFGTEEVQQLNKWIAVAVEIVKKRHPKLSPDTDKFGQVVNATVSHLIALTR